MLFFALLFYLGEKKGPTKTLSWYPRGVHQYHFYEPQGFLKALSQLSPVPQSTALAGGIIPHHLLPSDMIARFFKRLSLQNPQTIILIGPNHYEKGKARVITSDWDWQTPFGNVSAQQADIDTLVNQNIAALDYEIIEFEHSVAGMMPFIKHFLPQAKVIPLVLSNTLTIAEIKDIANQLERFVDENTVVVAPIDFSHYLTSKEAEEKDTITWEAIKNYDFERLSSMNSDYLDGPASLILTMMIMQKLGKTKIELFEHTNSGKIVNDPYVSTTSYFSAAFYK